MTNFKGYIHFLILTLPNIIRYKMKITHLEFIPILGLYTVAARYINDIFLNILFNNKPRTSTQTKPLPLPDSMKPITMMCT